MNTETRRQVVHECREALYPLVEKITAGYKTDIAADPTTELQVGVAFVVTKDNENYQQGDVGFYYGDNRLVVGHKVGAQVSIPSPDNFKLATLKQQLKGVDALSDKRVTTLIRNIVISAHESFPENTFDYQKNSPI